MKYDVKLTSKGQIALPEFFKDIFDARIRVEPVSSDIVIASLELISRKHITPIDSILYFI